MMNPAEFRVVGSFITTRRQRAVLFKVTVYAFCTVCQHAINQSINQSIKQASKFVYDASVHMVYSVFSLLQKLEKVEASGSEQKWRNCVMHVVSTECAAQWATELRRRRRSSAKYHAGQVRKYDDALFLIHRFNWLRKGKGKGKGKGGPYSEGA